MKVIRYALLLCFVALAGLSVKGQSADSQNLLVDVPKPPEYLERLDQRCNYIISKFWDRANLKSAFSSLDRMNATFGHFLAYTPYATADTVQMAIADLIKGVEKADAKNLAKLGAMAERWVGSDTCEYASEEMMYMFADGLAKSKKFKGPEKERYVAMAKRLGSSRTGVTVPDFTFTTPDGSTGKFSDVQSGSYLLFFYEPDCIDCRLGRTRLSQNYVIKTLISHNLLKVIAIYPGEPDEAWQKDIESMPDSWIIGANPDIDTIFTINHSPEIYYLDENRVVDSKGFSVDTALRYFDQFLNYRPAQTPAQSTAAPAETPGNETAE